MSNYPGAIDSVASLYSAVDAFSGAPLETTTTGAVLPGDSTISVSSTSGGFAATYGVLSIAELRRKTSCSSSKPRSQKRLIRFKRRLLTNSTLTLWGLYRSLLWIVPNSLFKGRSHFGFFIAIVEQYFIRNYVG